MPIFPYKPIEKPTKILRKKNGWWKGRPHARERNPKVLQSFRGPGTCGLCGKPVKSREPHHIKTKGSGGGDTPDNLLPVCKSCHHKIHNGLISRKDVREAKLNKT